MYAYFVTFPAYSPQLPLLLSLAWTESILKFLGWRRCSKLGHRWRRRVSSPAMLYVARWPFFFTRSARYIKTPRRIVVLIVCGSGVLLFRSSVSDSVHKAHISLRMCLCLHWPRFQRYLRTRSMCEISGGLTMENPVEYAYLFYVASLPSLRLRDSSESLLAARWVVGWGRQERRSSFCSPVWDCSRSDD